MIKLFSPKVAYHIAGYLEMTLRYFLPVYLIICLYLIANAPLDIVQGWSYLWIYLHVPAALISLFSAVVVFTLVSIGWIYRIHVATTLAYASAQVGFTSSMIALISGSIWGSQTWGAWWVWDMRLTSELLLALLYAAYITTEQAVTLKLISRRLQFYISFLITLNVPIVHFSVEWWYSLHQPSTLLSSEMTMPARMYLPLLTMIVFAILVCCWYVSRRLVLAYQHRFAHEALSSAT
ncbi:cytochrome c biogenesis protein CcsA [Gammaproteobacteria bacterium]|nr:cytochrome c biogenesis protein CcsA [Gammaproteobacteria bacterium]